MCNFNGVVLYANCYCSYIKWAMPTPDSYSVWIYWITIVYRPWTAHTHTHTPSHARYLRHDTLHDQLHLALVRRIQSTLGSRRCGGSKIYQCCSPRGKSLSSRANLQVLVLGLVLGPQWYLYSNRYYYQLLSETSASWIKLVRLKNSFVACRFWSFGPSADLRISVDQSPQFSRTVHYANCPLCMIIWRPLILLSPIATVHEATAKNSLLTEYRC